MRVTTQHAEEVLRWGNAEPWKNNRLGSLPKNKAFGPEHVQLDARGNIISMPRLLGRPCFGRVETRTRHGAKKTQRNIRGKIQEVESRCGRCLVRDACLKVVYTRISGNPMIASAFRKWHSECMAGPGTPTFTGPRFGQLWVEVKQAIIDSGPFENANDAAVAEHEASKQERRRNQWRQSQRGIRASSIARGGPDTLMIRNAPAERDRRAQSLKNACRSSSASRAMKAWNDDTCDMIADVWLARTILQASRRKNGPTDIVKWLQTQGKDRGKSFGALRTRVNLDLKRLTAIEALEGPTTIWPPFDPATDAILNELYEATKDH